MYPWKGAENVLLFDLFSHLLVPSPKPWSLLGSLNLMMNKTNNVLIQGAYKPAI
jgi:hypothetical protein